MKLKDTIKLLKYTQTPELHIVTAIMFGLCALVTAIPTHNNLDIGGFWANYMPTYFIGQMSMVTFAGVVQSSEKFKKTVTRNLAILLAIFNIVNFGIFVVLRTFLAYKMHLEKNVNGFLISYMAFQILYVLYGTIIYKNLKLGLLFMVPIFMFIIFSTMDHGPLKYFIKLGAMADIKVFIALTAAVSLLTPLLYYGLSLLLYKMPYYEKIVERMERKNI